MIFLRNLSCSHQIWPLTQFVLSPFCKRSLICLEGKSMTPCQGTIPIRSSLKLPRLHLRSLKGFLSTSTTRRPLRTLDLSRVRLLELKRNKDTGRCAAPGEEVPGLQQLHLLTQTLIVGVLKTHFFHRSSIAKSQHNRIELGTRPGKLCVNIDLRHLPKTLLDWLGGKSASSFDNKYNRT